MATKAEIIDAYFRSKNYFPHVPYVPIGEMLVEEVERMGPDGLYLSTACALIEKESGGKNLFGCDAGKTQVAPYCQQEVTRVRVLKLLELVNSGGPSNGVGLTQLTWPPFIKEAQKMGGAHLPKYQMRVGFRVLNDHIARYGWPSGAGAYNAGGAFRDTVGKAYGADMARLEREWAARLARADDTRKEPSNPMTKIAEDVEKAIAFGTKLIGAPYGTGWKAGTWPDLSPLYANITRHDPPAYYREREIICSALGNVLRFEVCELPAFGRKQGDDWPGGTAAIGRHHAFAPGTKPYPLKANTPRGWGIWSPYLGPALQLQGHFAIALGDGKVLEARVPTLSDNRTEDEVHRALIAGGGKGNKRIIPPSIWMRR